jgi:hypothetical protein
MMNFEAMMPMVGGVQVQTTSQRGFTPEEVAARCADKLISIGDQSHPLIRDQARAFKEQIRAAVTFYVKDAVRNDRHTIAMRLRDAGHPELIKAILED